MSLAGKPARKMEHVAFTSYHICTIPLIAKLYLYTIDLKVFQGNSDGNTPVARMFPEPVMARFITIFPTAWHLNIGLRFELLGCTTGQLPYLPSTRLCIFHFMLFIWKK